MDSERERFIQASAQRFGAWVRKLRGSRSQASIGELIGGASQGRVSDIERGRVVVSAELATQVADALGQPDLFALIEAGYVRSVGTEAAELAVMYEGLTGERRELARSMLRHLWERENAQTNRGGRREDF